jgi:hypothetical protein
MLSCFPPNSIRDALESAQGAATCSAAPRLIRNAAAIRSISFLVGTIRLFSAVIFDMHHYHNWRKFLVISAWSCWLTRIPVNLAGCPRGVERKRRKQFLPPSFTQRDRKNIETQAGSISKPSRDLPLRQPSNKNTNTTQHRRVQRAAAFSNRNNSRN